MNMIISVAKTSIYFRSMCPVMWYKSSKERWNGWRSQDVVFLLYVKWKKWWVRKAFILVLKGEGLRNKKSHFSRPHHAAIQRAIATSEEVLRPWANLTIKCSRSSRSSPHTDLVTHGAPCHAAYANLTIHPQKWANGIPQGISSCVNRISEIEVITIIFYVIVNWSISHSGVILVGWE